MPIVCRSIGRLLRKPVIPGYQLLRTGGPSHWLTGSFRIARLTLGQDLLEQTRSSAKRGTTTARSSPFFRSRRSGHGRTRGTSGSRKPSGTVSASFARDWRNTSRRRSRRDRTCSLRAALSTRRTNAKSPDHLISSKNAWICSSVTFEKNA